MNLLQEGVGIVLRFIGLFRNRPKIIHKKKNCEKTQEWGERKYKIEYK